MYLLNVSFTDEFCEVFSLLFQIIDISRMLAKAAQSQAERQAERDADDGGGMKNHPVIRTMYDHDLVSVTFNLICYYYTSLIFYYYLYLYNLSILGLTSQN